MTKSPEVSAAIREFVVLIAHGNEAHRRWLMRAGEAYINGDEVLQDTAHVPHLDVRNMKIG